MSPPIASVPCFEFDQRLPGGFRLPARMTVLPLADGKLALVSPIPLDERLLRQLHELGEVAFLIAPNLLHHLYLADAVRHFPAAQVLAPPGLSAKRPDLVIHQTLDQPLPQQLAAAVTAIRIEGAPSIDEYGFFHRPTGALVLTDLVFNVERPRGFMAHLVLWLVGCHGRLASSRVWRLSVKQRAAARRSVERLLALPVQTLVVAHGAVVRERARERLQEALRWLHPTMPALAAGGAHESRSGQAAGQ
jgi:hypothetical protein